MKRILTSSSSELLLYVTFWHKWCTNDDIRVGMIGHGVLLKAFSFARQIRGSGHV